MKTLVTGAAGFIGSHVARHLLADGIKVVALDDLSGGYRTNVPSDAVFVRGSINDKELLGRLFAKYRFDYVFHLAAYAAEGLSHFVRRFNYENNLIGSINLINESIKYRVKCFVYTSSIAVYGAARPPMRESMIPHPEDPYGIAKYAVEQDLHAAGRLFGLPSIIFRPHNVYGEQQNIWDKYRNVVGIFMNQCLRGERMTVFGDGTQTRAFTHIDDVAPVIARSVRNRKAIGEVFNIGGDVPVAVNDLARLVADAMGVPCRMKHLKARHEVVHAYASHGKAARLFGSGRKITIEDGVARMAEWAKKAGGRKPRPFAAIEIRQGLPEGW